MPESPIRLAVTGAAGRMGMRLVALASADPALKVVAALESAGHAKLGQDAGAVAGAGPAGVAISDELKVDADVMIDFTVPAASLAWLRRCQQGGVSMVIGTTGFDAAAERAIEQAGETLAILKAANMSVGVNVLLRVVGELARALGEDYDIEVVEAHHRFKKDAPSGTALALARAIAQATGRSIDRDLVHGRHGKEAMRKRGEIGVHALRLGDTVGEHEIHFGTLGETVKVSHSAHTRDTFAAGALRAAKWLASREPGVYLMQDVLFGGK
ncbi:MAG: 4-hydroxy-tetrahydrodipicolinate reductase [Phycisphaerae bacterium]|nr:4-hydroxy-tetrahydrodipicolinate reductase [Phycisphaerae bacterium]